MELDINKCAENDKPNQEKGRTLRGNLQTLGNIECGGERGGERKI